MSSRLVRGAGSDMPPGDARAHFSTARTRITSDQHLNRENVRTQTKTRLRHPRRPQALRFTSFRRKPESSGAARSSDQPTIPGNAPFVQRKVFPARTRSEASPKRARAGSCPGTSTKPQHIGQAAAKRVSPAHERRKCPTSKDKGGSPPLRAAQGDAGERSENAGDARLCHSERNRGSQSPLPSWERARVRGNRKNPPTHPVHPVHPCKFHHPFTTTPNPATINNTRSQTDATR